MDKLTIISLDGHAQIPPDAWPKYLEKRYHEYLAGLNKENEVFSGVMRHFMARTHEQSKLNVFDFDGAVRGGGAKGLYDRQTRIAEMDREGITAEFIHSGDPRICGLFFQSSNTEYPMNLCQAGVKAYNRWLSDEFGPSRDRLLLIGIIGSAPWRDVEEMITELDWIADQGFVATTLPGFTAYPGQPALFHKYWDPFWARCEERGMALWMHAGQGERQAELGQLVQRIRKQIDVEGGSIDDLIERLSKEFFQGKVFSSAKPRRAMWQLMMGGVFDRHPRLKLVLSEIYGDWMPPTLRHLDEQFEKHRGELRAQRKPSEYWRSNGINGLSFIRRCEVALRHEIGVETMAFGRDYPHTEGTWPNTKLWLRDALAGVPADEARGIMGENAIRVLGLNRAKLSAVAQRVGPLADEILAPGSALNPELLAHFDKRAQYLQQPEGETRIPEIHAMLQEDLWRAGANAV